MLSKLLSAPADTQGATLTTYVNFFSYGLLRKEPGLLCAMDVVHFDGFLMTWALGTLGIRRERRSFDMTSMGADVLSDAEANGKTIVFVGGADGIAARAASVLKTSYPNLKVSGTFPGYYSTPAERTGCISAIVGTCPDIVIVGMGTIWQEHMLVDLRDAGFQGQGYTCGGFLHQTAAGRTHYYPAWVDRTGLRWLYRCIREPKVIRRLVVDYPLNTMHLLQDYREWRRAMGKRKAHG